MLLLAMSLTWTNVSNIILVWFSIMTEFLLYLPAHSSSPLPDFVPNTHPEEPSYSLHMNPEGGEDLSKRLGGQVTPSVVSRPSTPQQEPDDNEGAPPARKVSHSVILHLFNLHRRLSLCFECTAVETTSKGPAAFYYRHRRPLRY
jgi:hypothetical protein